MTFLSLTLALLVGQAAAASLARRNKNFIEADTTAEGLLAKVENMMQKGAAPDKIKTIEKLAGELEATLHDTRDAAQQQVDKNLARIIKCNDDQEAAYNKITVTTKKIVDKAFMEHEICRKSEKVKHEETTKKCNQLTEYLGQTVTNGPSMSSLLETDDDAEMVEYISEMDSYWCQMKKTAKEKNDKCKQEKNTHREEKVRCDKFQAQCELNFCSWRTQLVDVCGAHATCYDDALGVYNDHKKVTQQLVQGWKTEYVALKKISCYVTIWLNEENVKETHVQKLSGCKTLSPNDAVMEVDFKTPDDKATCSLEDVKYYPGTPEFKSMKFGQWDFVAEVTKCDSADESETPSGPTTTGQMNKANVSDCPMVNSFGQEMPVPPAEPFQCPDPYSLSSETAPKPCPCDTLCDCANTKMCMQTHVAAASPEAKEACDAVKMQTATKDQHHCCKKLLRPCLMYQEGCFTKLTEGYLNNFSPMLKSSNGALAQAESGSAWSSLMSRSTRSRAEVARDDGYDLDQTVGSKCG